MTASNPNQSPTKTVPVQFTLRSLLLAFVIVWSAMAVVNGADNLRTWPQGDQQIRTYHPHPALSLSLPRCAGQGEGTVESAARLKSRYGSRAKCRTLRYNYRTRSGVFWRFRVVRRDVQSRD